MSCDCLRVCHYTCANNLLLNVHTYTHVTLEKTHDGSRGACKRGCVQPCAHLNTTKTSTCKIQRSTTNTCSRTDEWIHAKTSTCILARKTWTKGHVAHITTAATLRANAEWATMYRHAPRQFNESPTALSVQAEYVQHMTKASIPLASPHHVRMRCGMFHRECGSFHPPRDNISHVSGMNLTRNPAHSDQETSRKVTSWLKSRHGAVPADT
jgi:hypothetical protein